MKTNAYKNLSSGATVTFEKGSRGDRKAKADTKKYQAIVDEVAPITIKPEPKKPEKSG